jgi:hypothetical protein
LLAICKSHKGWPAAHFVPERRRIRRAASLSVEVTDGVLRGQARNAASASARRINAAVPIRSNLLGLEHRLQTVVDGDGWAAAILLSRRYSATRPRRHTPPAHVPHRRLRLPCSFKGVGGASSSSASEARESAGMDRNPRSPAVSLSMVAPWETSRRTCRGPDGTQPEHSPSATPFIKPRAVNWQAACALCPNGAGE